MRVVGQIFGADVGSPERAPLGGDGHLRAAVNELSGFTLRQSSAAQRFTAQRERIQLLTLASRRKVWRYFTPRQQGLLHCVSARAWPLGQAAAGQKWKSPALGNGATNRSKASAYQIARRASGLRHPSLPSVLCHL